MSLEDLGTPVQEKAVKEAHEKTPVQQLNEYCSKSGTAAPEYIWSKDGDPFGPVVTCTITVGDVIGTGEGTRKQTAKQNAAAVVWARLQPEVAALASRQAATDDSNPVGALQELAVRERLPPPQYLLVDEQGKTHEKVFTMACQWDGHEGTATGPSKQAAKHGAASKVREQLRQPRQENECADLQAEGPQEGAVEDAAPSSLTPCNTSVSNGV